MAAPFIQRRHRNQAIARVTFDPASREYSVSAVSPTGDLQQVPERFSGPDAETRARAAADALAHPLCIGADCPGWQTGSRVGIQPAQGRTPVATSPPPVLPSAPPPKPPAASILRKLATRTRDTRTFVERTHRNGVVARVNRLTQFDTFQATAYHNKPGDLPVNPVIASAEDEAMVAADHLAHPHCTGHRCEEWPPAPWAKPVE